MELTKDMLRKMRHCLGLNKKSKPFRNYYYLHSLDKDWEYLIEKKLAKKINGNQRNSVYYYCTMEGLELCYGKKIKQSEYNDLR